jgi:hypothetical protein
MSIPLPSLWGETWNLSGLYSRKIVNLSETDERGLCSKGDRLGAACDFRIIDLPSDRIFL